MASTPSSTQDLKIDPSRRYTRLNKIVGEGARKKVYLGFDSEEGKEIAWSLTQLTEKDLKSKDYLEALCTEARLLKALDHENIMRCYDSWTDDDRKIIHMITEFFNSGRMSQYISSYFNLVDDRSIKKWARQILQAIHYLHSQRPPIVHRDIKCGNIFVNGNTGNVKLGDFGSALILEHGSCYRTHGTLHYMAPEVCQGKYNHLADIYSFGMSILQMVTREVPYGECNNNKDQIREKLRSGKLPALLSKVRDPEVKGFIMKCLVPASNRPAAVDLLNDPFLGPSVSSTLTASNLLSLEEFRKSVCDQATRLLPKTFRLNGVKKDNESVSMRTWIAYYNGYVTMDFECSQQTDRNQSVVQRIATTNCLSHTEATLFSELVYELITALNLASNPQIKHEITCEQRVVTPICESS